MTTTAWDREKPYANWEELLKRATKREEADKIATANQLNSPLLRLPGEIRNQIYTYVCQSTTVKHVKHGKHPEEAGGSCFFTQTFLITCKQVYCEAVALIYSLATFHLSGSEGWQDQKGLNPKYRSLITSLSVGRGAGPVALALMMCRNGPNAMTEDCLPGHYLPSIETVYLADCSACDLKRDALREWFKNEDLEVMGVEIPSEERMRTREYLDTLCMQRCLARMRSRRLVEYQVSNS